jgi:hypothetical protein
LFWYWERLTSPPSPEFQCYWIIHCSDILPPLDFPCPSVHIITFLGLPTLHVITLPWSSTGLQHLQPPLFCFIWLFITICCTGFYLFVLCSSLLICFLSHLSLPFTPLLRLVYTSSARGTFTKQ